MHHPHPERAFPPLSDDESDLIGLINERYPMFSDISHFLHGETHHSGLIAFRWKFHHERVLYMGWDATRLSVRQRLVVNGWEMAVTFPVTWNEGTKTLIFDRNGELRVLGNTADELWRYATGYEGL